MQNINYPTAFLVTDTIGNAGTLYVDLNTTSEQFIGWYASHEVAISDVTQEIVDALEDVLLYLQTGGRARDMEDMLGLDIKATQDRDEAEAEVDRSIVNGTMEALAEETSEGADMPALRVMQGPRRIWDFGELANGVHLGVVRRYLPGKPEVYVVEFATDLEHPAHCVHFVIREVCSSLEEAVRKAARIRATF